MIGIMLNHPSTIWTRQCAENYDYLLELWINFVMSLNTDMVKNTQH